MDRTGDPAETGGMRSLQRTEIPADSYTLVSRHTTSEGVVVWMRCTRCGQPRMLLQPHAPSGGYLAAGHHLSRCPNCG